MVGELDKFIYTGTISLSFNVSLLPNGITVTGKLKQGNTDICDFESSDIVGGILTMTVVELDPVPVGTYRFIATFLDTQNKPIDQQEAPLYVIPLL